MSLVDFLDQSWDHFGTHFGVKFGSQKVTTNGTILKTLRCWLIGVQIKQKREINRSGEKGIGAGNLFSGRDEDLEGL